MSQTLSYELFRMSYKTEVTNIIRDHHVYMQVWRATQGKVLDMRKAAVDMR